MTHKTKILFFQRLGMISFFLVVASLIGCSAPEKRLEKERLTLVYRPQSALDSEIKKLRLEHPIKILREQTRNHLLSLHYEELSLLGKKRYIFSANDVFEITPLITKALSRVKANNILYYELDTEKGTTAGTIFKAKGKVHFRFEAINGVDFLNSSFPGFRGSTWRLMPINGQTYGQSNNFLGNQIRENWIVSSLNLPVKSKRSRSSSHSFQKSSRNGSHALKKKGPKIPSANQSELKKRLQFLKELRDGKLINDEEYKRKRRLLLDKFL